MATKKGAKKTAAKKPASTRKPVVKKEVVKKTVKSTDSSIYTANISILLAMAIEAMILLLAYMIIMNHIN